eukprot:SAG31_NODE_1340_length_8709_cov_8.259117_5_plen_249_part_00
MIPLGAADTSQGGIGQRPVLEFSAAVRAGSTMTPSTLEEQQEFKAKGGSGCDPTHPGTILFALKRFLSGSQRQSFLPSAPGGGTENVGITQAVNDMLVQAPHGDFISLFPVWDKSQDASFRSLLVKGAVEVSATWSAAQKEELNVSVVARSEHVGPVVILCTSSLCGTTPKPRFSAAKSEKYSQVATPVPNVKVQCDANKLGDTDLRLSPVVSIKRLDGHSSGLFGLSFSAPAGHKCSLIPLSTQRSQ